MDVPRAPRRRAPRHERRRRRPPAAWLLLVLPLVAQAAPAPVTIVACAPGYPGTTEEAQPSMDAFAAGLAGLLGWTDRGVAAVYHPTLDEGLAALSGPGAGLALVPLPFYLEYRQRLGLAPLLLVEQRIGVVESWSLAAPRGAVRGPASLAGWQLAGMPAYSPRFVRRVALAGWGQLPGDVELRFTARVLSSLRRAAAGEKIAVLLDGAQGEALGQLPFAGELEVVARSEPLPASLLCSVGGRLSPPDAEAVVGALRAMHDTETGPELLGALRIVRFHPLPAEGLRGLEERFGGVAD